MTATWEHFPHGADVGVRGRGATLAEAFAGAALALTAAVTDPAGVRAEMVVEIACKESDPELLLNDWLNAVIYEMATRHLLFGRFQVCLDGPRLAAVAWGEPVDAPRHQPAAEPKGATLTALRVARSDHGGWLAQCVIDV